jgi:putative thioredoxin
MASTASSWVIDVDESNFEEQVLRQSMQRPVIVDFWAPWCGPCRTLGPKLEKMTQELNGAVVLAKVNVDEAQQLAGAFQIEGIPAVRAFKDGQLVLQFDGALPDSQLREFFTRLGATLPDPTLEKAKSLEETKPAEAEALYRKYLEKEPTNDEARVGLARALMAQNKDDQIAALLEPIDASGPFGEEAQRIRSVLSLKGMKSETSGDEATLRKQIESDPKAAQPRYELGCLLAQKGKHEEALKLLLEAGERDMKLASSKVREAMVQIFYALGPSHPLSDRYRAQLARLLY